MTERARILRCSFREKGKGAYFGVGIGIGNAAGGRRSGAGSGRGGSGGCGGRGGGGGGAARLLGRRFAQQRLVERRQSVAEALSLAAGCLHLHLAVVGRPVRLVRLAVVSPRLAGFFIRAAKFTPKLNFI